MKLKRVCFLLFGALFVLLLNEIAAIANFQQQNNHLTEDDQRAAERDQNALPTHHQPQIYQAAPAHPYPDYGTLGTAFSSPGYSYPSYPSGHGYHQAGHVGQGYQHAGHEHHGLALKGFLIPLAGIALLGAAAALATSPVLLQLGVVSGKRRRRRALLPENRFLSNERQIQAANFLE